MAMAEYLLKLKDYQAEVEKIQNGFKAENETYQAKADVFARQMEQYQKDAAKWEIDRNSAVSAAEGLIEPFHENFKWTFVDKNEQKAYLGKVINTWMMQGIIILVLMVLAILLIWRKDKVS